MSSHAYKIEKAGVVSDEDLTWATNWYRGKLNERKSPEPESLYGVTLRALRELSALRGVAGTESPAEEPASEPARPKFTPRQLQVLALVSSSKTRHLVSVERDAAQLGALQDKGALSDWYELTDLGRDALTESRGR